MTLNLSGTVEVSVDNVHARFVAEGERLFLDVDRPLAFFRICGLLHPDSRAALRLVAQELYGAGLTLRLSRRGRLLAVIGYEAVAAGLIGRLLGVEHVALAPGAGLLRLLGR